MDTQTQAPFNMAINTLERLGEILRDTHKTAADTLLSPAQKQFVMISHVKHFFSHASPLLAEADGLIERLEPKILALRPVEQKVIRTKGGLGKGEEIQLIFSQELEDTMLKLLVEMQVELQKLKFFMPPRRNLGAVVGDFY